MTTVPIDPREVSFDHNCCHPGVYLIPNQIPVYGRADFPNWVPPELQNESGVVVGRFDDGRHFLSFAYLGDFGWNWRAARPVVPAVSYCHPLVRVFESKPGDAFRVVPEQIPYYKSLPEPLHRDDIAVLDNAVLFARELGTIGLRWVEVPLVTV